VPWTSRTNWASFDAVVVRSTWDYQHDLPRFHAVLGEICESGAALHNSLALILWNSTKRYLHHLAQRGVPIAPTLWLDQLNVDDVRRAFRRFESDELVLKPQLGANSQGVFRLCAREGDEWVDDVGAFYGRRPLFIQPFVRSILDEGEYSLFYFNGQLSHAIRKIPRGGDFRSQEEYGAEIQSVTPTVPLRSAGATAVAAVPEVPLYARVDLVRANGSESFWVMELELIEPSLYLRMEASAPLRFAEAFDRRMQDRCAD